MNKITILAFTGFLLVLIAWTVFSRENDEAGDTFIFPQSGDFEVTITASGELRARNSLTIMGPRGAREVGIWRFEIIDMVPEGTEVNQGDYIAQLDLTELHTELQEAELDVQEVEAQYEQAQLDSSLTLTEARYNIENLELQIEESRLAVEQSIYESPAVQRQAQIELERVERQYAQEQINYETRRRQAEARLREIEADLLDELNTLESLQRLDDEFTIRSPRDGMVVYLRDRRGRRTTVGSTVRSHDPEIATLPDFGAMESITYINEVEIQKIKPGLMVDIGLDADPDKKLTGEIISVANIGEQRSGTDARVFEVVVHINEYDPELRPTMTTSNTIHVYSESDVTYVPLETIYLIDDSHFVYKREDSNIVLQQVLLGPMNNTDVIVLAGISESDEILISSPPDADEVNRYMLPEEVIEQNKNDMDAVPDELSSTIEIHKDTVNTFIYETPMA
ncbi:MAG: efflux RND transporter periplasmic adaptor subunit [Balneolales bacterium]